MLNELLFIKIKEENIGNIIFQQNGSMWNTAEATLYGLRSVFENRIVCRKADIVWPPRSSDLTPLDCYMWGADKDKSYADKQQGEIQLHTNDNVLKNCIDRVGYCMASRDIYLNEIIFHY